MWRFASVALMTAAVVKALPDVAKTSADKRSGPEDGIGIHAHSPNKYDTDHFFEPNGTVQHYDPDSFVKPNGSARQYDPDAFSQRGKAVKLTAAKVTAAKAHSSELFEFSTFERDPTDDDDDADADADADDASDEDEDDV